MGYLFARQELYELVWFEPITTLAKSLGLSGVGLANACRRGDIPVPPRGYGAILDADQRVARAPLPRSAPGATDRVGVGAGRPQPFRPDHNGGNDGAGSSVKQDELPPASSVYDETLEVVEVRIRQALLAEFRCLPARDNAHSQIARLLREDRERRDVMTKNRYAFDKPCFESRFEQRRLVASPTVRRHEKRTDGDRGRGCPLAAW